MGKDRVNVVLGWYRKNVGGEYVPVVQSGKSFREKFVKLEAAMERDGGYKRRGGTREKSKHDDENLETETITIRK